MEFVKEVNGHLCRAQFDEAVIQNICLPLLHRLPTDLTFKINSINPSDAGNRRQHENT